MKGRVKAFDEIGQVGPLNRGEKAASFKHVQEFLCRFGYLDKHGYEEDRLDDATSEALAEFQRGNGRRATGTFNKATRDQMTTARCAFPDRHNGIAFTAVCAWDKSELTFAFDQGTPDVSGENEFQAVRNAFQTWAAVTPLTFTEVSVDDNPDIQIGWRPADDTDLSMVGGTLAHADFPPGCGVVTDTLPKPIHFDDSEHRWRIGSFPNSFDIETVALHEIGHILGLAHSDVPDAVMFASVGANRTKRDLTADDIAGVQGLYPQAAASSLRDRLLERVEAIEKEVRGLLAMVETVQV